MILQRAAAAERDLDDIWLYVARRNERAANALITDIEAAARRIEAFPDHGVARPELGLDIRAVRVGNYVLFYRRREDVALVLERVLHTRRDATAIDF